MGFKGDLILKKISAKRYKVWKRFSYTSKKGEKFIVPKGFKTDGASIPRIVWPLIGSPFTGRYSQAAVLHDFLYYTQMTTRRKADRIFLEAMGVLKVPFWKRTIMYLAVRVAGWIPWYNYYENKSRKSNRYNSCGISYLL
jgi:hypothetical protein